MVCPYISECKMLDRFATFLCHLRDLPCSEGLSFTCDSLDKMNECLTARVEGCENCK